MSCGVVCRRGSDPELLWLCCSLLAAAPIRPLAWESPYAKDVALKSHTQKKKEKKSEQEQKLPHGNIKKGGHE